MEMQSERYKNAESVRNAVEKEMTGDLTVFDLNCPRLSNPSTPLLHPKFVFVFCRE
jgi:hypothetical protein